MDKEFMSVVLVDGSYYLHRAYHALPSLTTKSGFPTNAIRGLAGMLMGLQQDHPDAPVVVVMDAPGKTFRSERFPDYKAHRPKMPDDLRMQIDKARQVVEAMGISYFSETGVEADDVIGTLALRSASEGRSVVISSGDKDLMQLVNDSIVVKDPMRNKIYDRNAVQDKYGVYPERIIDLLALCGDSSDNIPGVAGVGPKTALSLLDSFDSVDGIYQNLDQVRTSSLRGAESLAEKLVAHEEDARLSYWLATIKTDVALDFDWQEMTSVTIKDELFDLFEELEFKTLTQRLRIDADTERQVETSADWKDLVVLDKQGLDQWVERIGKADYFGFDTETTSLNYMEARLVGISVAVDAESGVYIPIAHDYSGAPKQLSLEVVLDAMREILEDENCAKVGHNLKYDRAVLANHGITLRGIASDTMLAAYALRTGGTRLSLSALVNHYFGDQPMSYEDVAGKGSKQISFNQVELGLAAPYAVADACGSWKLHTKLNEDLSGKPNLQGILNDLDIPLLTVLSDMERCGVLIDVDVLKKCSEQWAGELEKLKVQACEIVGFDFNMDSPKQLREILYEKFELPVLGVTSQRQPSTAEPVLKRLVDKHPLPKLLLQYRELAKLKSTYADSLPKAVYADTGRVHSSWNQAAVSTGRLASSEPNLQNIPIRSENGRKIRRAFVAQPGHVLLAADYSQIELRVMAHMSEDEAMRQAFAEDMDIHSATASEIFDVPLDQVDDSQRRSAKAINFGLIYGMSAFGLARQLNIAKKAADEYIQLYFGRYPKVREYMDAVCDNARDSGYVETLLGRQIFISALDSKNMQQRRGAERFAINAPIQGTAADIIKKAMLGAHALFGGTDSPARMIMQVHDELVLEVKEDQVEQTQSQLREVMEQAVSFSVPLRVDMGSGRNWDEAHP